ncbi:hypothetical protein SFRURICE_019931, partial [Spodoptera frugiperda]
CFHFYYTIYIHFCLVGLVVVCVTAGQGVSASIPNFGQRITGLFSAFLKFISSSMVSGNVSVIEPNSLLCNPCLKALNQTVGQATGCRATCSGFDSRAGQLFILPGNSIPASVKVSLFFFSVFRKFLSSSTEFGIVPNIWQYSHPLIHGTYNKWTASKCGANEVGTITRHRRLIDNILLVDSTASLVEWSQVQSNYVIRALGSNSRVGQTTTGFFLVFRKFINNTERHGAWNCAQYMAIGSSTITWHL